MSIQGSTIIPSLRYRDAHAAMAWLERVFGMRRQAMYEGPNGTVAHAQMTLGGGMVMLGSTAVSEGGAYAHRWVDLKDTEGRETVGLCLIVRDEECVAIHGRAAAEGAEMVQPLNEPEYGGKAFACRDLEGHIWWIGSYNPWGEPAGAEGTA